MPDRTPCVNHLWQPMADTHRIWQQCVHCHVEQHVVTHDQQLRDTIADIFRDHDPPDSVRPTR